MKTVIEMAREAGVMPIVLNHWSNELERFYQLAVAAEREACAQACEEDDRYRGDHFAALIRARGQA